MTFRQVAKALALFSVFALGLLSILGSNPNSSGNNTPPVPTTPSAVELQIPGAPADTWEHAPLRQNGTFTVLPLGPSFLSSPIFRVSFLDPANTSLHITAQIGTSPPVEIPNVAATQLTSGTAGYTLLPNPDADRWLVEIGLPYFFKDMTQFTINISDVAPGAEGAPVIESAPVILKLVSRMYDVLVAVSRTGHIGSNPPGNPQMDCGNLQNAQQTACLSVYTGPAPGPLWTPTTEVNLNVGSAGQTYVKGWSGDCSFIGMLQSQQSTQSTCTVVTDGVTQVMATAIFDGAAMPPPPSCPLIAHQCFTGSGDMPQCKTSFAQASFGADCDSMGFYTCPSGIPFCPTGFSDAFFQPGGCYHKDLVCTP